MWSAAAAACALLASAAAPAQGAGWSRAYINALPDEAFAVVEVRSDGRRARHLPHHDAEGRVDLPHLRSALSRIHQVDWLDSANADRAREHLGAHLREAAPRAARRRVERARRPDGAW